MGNCTYALSVFGDIGSERRAKLIRSTPDGFMVYINPLSLRKGPRHYKPKKAIGQQLRTQNKLLQAKSLSAQRGKWVFQAVLAMYFLDQGRIYPPVSMIKGWLIVIETLSA